MVKAKLCDLVSVFKDYQIIKFELSSYDTPYEFEGTIKEFVKSVYYRTFATDWVSELKITGDCLLRCSVVIKLVPPID